MGELTKREKSALHQERRQFAIALAHAERRGLADLVSMLNRVIDDITQELDEAGR